MSDRNYYQDLVNQAQESCDKLKTLAAGSKERQIEAQVYDSLNQRLIEMEKMANQTANDEAKSNLEKEKLEHDKKFDKIKAVLEAIGLGLAGAQIASYTYGGILQLKANMVLGNMVGKDGKACFNDVKNVKLTRK